MNEVKRAQRDLIEGLAGAASEVASKALRLHTMSSGDTSEQQAQRFAYNAVYVAFDQFEQQLWVMYAAVGNDEEE